METKQVEKQVAVGTGENLNLSRKKIVIVDDFEESCKLLCETEKFQI